LTTFFLPGAGFKPGAIAISELAPTAFYPAATLLPDLPGIRPASNLGASRTKPAVGFTDYPNSVMNGCSYKSIPKMELSACETACAADTACQAFSHSKITQACELKHTLTARRLDPRWTSGAPAAGPAPGRSIRADTMVTHQDYQRFGKNVRLEGKLIDEANVESPESCSKRCKSDPMCLALEFGTNGNVCRRFSEVTGVLEEPVKSYATGIEIKTQR